MGTLCRFKAHNLSCRHAPQTCGMCVGVLAARAASTVTGQASDDTGIRIESIIKAGLTGPMAEALAMYYQVSRTQPRVRLAFDVPDPC